MLISVIASIQSVFFFFFFFINDNRFHSKAVTILALFHVGIHFYWPLKACMNKLLKEYYKKIN